MIFSFFKYIIVKLLQNVYAPEPDPELTLEDYERTFDQNEDLGLNDMNVEDQSKDQSK